MIYEIRWVAYTCAGVFRVLGLSFTIASAPAAAHPALAAIGLCRAEARVERYDPARLERARDRARDLGAGAQLLSCRGLRCSDNLADWKTDVKFKEAP
ncbi:MAG: hypothetical protein PHS14_02960 [Elusimicrobia bacterium]|nr:hypothetical protein [Elusimicrobiota bacterium]